MIIFLLCLILWLVLGCVGYLMAVAMRVDELYERIHDLESDGDFEDTPYESPSAMDYTRGMLGILLGPGAIALVLYLVKDNDVKPTK